MPRLVQDGGGRNLYNYLQTHETKRFPMGRVKARRIVEQATEAIHHMPQVDSHGSHFQHAFDSIEYKFMPFHSILFGGVWSTRGNSDT